MKKFNKTTLVFAFAVFSLVSVFAIADNAARGNGAADGTQSKTQQRLRDGSGLVGVYCNGTGVGSGNQIHRNGNAHVQNKKSNGNANGASNGTQSKTQQRLRDGSELGGAYGNGTGDGAGNQVRSNGNNGKGRNRR